MRKRQGQGLIVGIVGIAVAIVGSVFAADQLLNILNFLFTNTLGIVFVGVLALGGAILFIEVRQDDISGRRALIGFGILLALVIASPFAVALIQGASTSWTATIEIQTGQDVVGVGDISFDGLRLVSVGQEGGPFFPNQKGCVVGCDDWQADVTTTCNGETKQQTVTGDGGDDKEVKVRDLPDNARCETVVELSASDDDKQIEGNSRKVVSYSTG